jgi:hypothetical protein
MCQEPRITVLTRASSNTLLDCAITSNMTILWDVTTCSLVYSRQHFGASGTWPEPLSCVVLPLGSSLAVRVAWVSDRRVLPLDMQSEPIYRSESNLFCKFLFLLYFILTFPLYVVSFECCLRAVSTSVLCFQYRIAETNIGFSCSLKDFWYKYSEIEEAQTHSRDGCLYIVCSVCVGSDLATGWLLVQAVLPSV